MKTEVRSSSLVKYWQLATIPNHRQSNVIQQYIFYTFTALYTYFSQSLDTILAQDKTHILMQRSVPHHPVLLHGAAPVLETFHHMTHHAVTRDPRCEPCHPQFPTFLF